MVRNELTLDLGEYENEDEEVLVIKRGFREIKVEFNQHFNRFANFSSWRVSTHLPSCKSLDGCALLGLSFSVQLKLMFAQSDAIFFL